MYSSIVHIGNIVRKRFKENISVHLFCIKGNYCSICNALQAGRSRVRFPMVSLEFFIDIIFPVELWP
jgi:hypothetical protein